MYLYIDNHYYSGYEDNYILYGEGEIIKTHSEYISSHDHFMDALELFVQNDISNITEILIMSKLLGLEIKKTIFNDNNIEIIKIKNIPIIIREWFFNNNKW